MNYLVSAQAGAQLVSLIVYLAMARWSFHDNCARPPVPVEGPAVGMRERRAEGERQLDRRLPRPDGIARSRTECANR